MKFSNTSEDNEHFIRSVVEEVIGNYNVPVKIYSVDKQSDVIKIKKSALETDFLTEKDSCVHLIVYEAAFDLLNEETQKLLVERALCALSFNLDNGKITISNDIERAIYGLRSQHKYSDTDLLDMMEAAKAAIDTIENIKKGKTDETGSNK